MCLLPLSGECVASFPHELKTSNRPHAPKPIRESREEQSFCWLAMMPIHALEWLGLSPTTLNPSLLQLGCREACEPISNFHVLRPTELLRYFPSAIRESRPACWWQWIWADCRSSYRGRPGRRMFSSWLVTLSLVSQSQYCLLKGCKHFCCSKTGNHNGKYSEI